jgi:hypothetical protein
MIKIWPNDSRVYCKSSSKNWIELIEIEVDLED